MFLIVGLILVVFGLVSDPGLYKRSLGININLWWGLIQALFGAVMLVTAWRAAATAKASQPPA
jgi:hypothetical protein